MSILYLLIIIFFCILLLSFLSPILPKWFCEKFSWHVPPKEKHFDGENYYGYCPRCGRKLIKNLQGEWY